jgi:fructan beta-fructosidase
MSQSSQPKPPRQPQWHYRVPQGWLNDPNGLFYHEGVYHLYYQHHPDSTSWGTMHWGHATSYDLLRWQDHPIALYPDDIGAIFSGCIVNDKNNTSGLVIGGCLVAIYSYDNQSLGLAYSIDGGFRWMKHHANPIMPAQAKDFRDPRIQWDADENAWLMVIAAGDEIRFYSSQNLLDWQFLSAFHEAKPDGVTPDLYEVPDLIAFEGHDGVRRYALIVSVNPQGTASEMGTRYFIGEWDGMTFTDSYPQEALWLDQGNDNYAGTCFIDSDTNQPKRTPEGGVYFIGWANNWAYAHNTPAQDWRGMMTGARTLEMAQSGDVWRLVQQPIISETAYFPDVVYEEIRNVEGTYDIGTLKRPYTLSLKCILADAQSITLTLGEGENVYRIHYDATTQDITCERPQANIDKMNTRIVTHMPEMVVPIRNYVVWELVVDGDLLEFFAQDGALAVTHQIYGVGATSDAEADGDAIQIQIQGKPFRWRAEGWQL